MKILCVYFNPPHLKCIASDPGVQLQPHEVRVVHTLNDAVSEIEKTMDATAFDFVLTDLAIPESSEHTDPSETAMHILMRFVDENVIGGMGVFSGISQSFSFQVGSQSPGITKFQDVSESWASGNPIVFTSLCGGVLDVRNWKKLFDGLVELKRKSK